MRGDALALVEQANNYKVARMLKRMPHPYGRADAIGFIEVVAQRESERAYIVCSKRGTLVGVASFMFADGYPPMAPTDGNRKLLAMYSKVSTDLGFWPVTAVDPSRAGAADVSFVAKLIPMALDGLGLSGHDDHTEKETADLRMLPVQTKRAAVLMYRLSNPK